MTKEKFDKFIDFLYDLEKNLKKHMKNLLEGDYHNYIEIQGCANGLVAVNRLICDIQDADASEVEHVGDFCHDEPLNWLLYDMFVDGCNLGYVKELMESELSSTLGKEIIQELKEIYR